MASCVIDASDPETPIFPPGVKMIPVSNAIVLILYDINVHGPGPLTLASLLPGQHEKSPATHESKLLNEFVDTIRVYMAKGLYVIIRGWKPKLNIMWDEDCVAAFKGTLSQPVESQSE